MLTRLASLLVLSSLLVPSASGKDKKPIIPEDILRAQTVRVLIDPDAGEPLDQPNTNAMARDNVEKALMEWGRFRLMMDGAESDLIIVIRKGSGGMARPTLKGGPIDQRPGMGEGGDGNVRIGAQHGTPPPITDPTMDPRSRGPRVTNEMGPAEDMFTVYRGTFDRPLDAPPVWRYIKKDCLRASPDVPAVEEFRKLLAQAEQAKAGKKP